ncbi:ATP-binding protein [Pectinatus haikarae]|uniref:ATP-binding protein n=1 Tax=Pectinatus haikarae TaxID=349096 RepID=UPI0018C81484|nr:ATP-binding protein [Pectinatus haikarae]
MKNFIMTQAWLSRFMVISFFMITALLAVSSIYMKMNINAEKTAEEHRIMFQQLGESLAKASDYLTAEGRKYAVTGDRIHMENYWREIEQTRTRDYVIEKMHSANAPEDELALLEEAKKYSDELVETERRSMRLVLEAEHISEDMMPVSVASKKLESSDVLLSDKEKRAKAVEIMFDNKYDISKEHIMKPIAAFQQAMNSRLENELLNARQNLYRAFILQVVLACIIIAEILGLMRIFILYITRPIQHYTKKLEIFSFQQYFSLRAEGTKELCILADVFNALYLSFQEELKKRRETEKRMIIAKEDAEKANAAKSEFLANMSHEIRTPLNTIIGYHYMMEKQRLSAKVSAYAGNIGLAAQNLLDIVNEILDFSKIESGKIELEVTPFNFRKTLIDIYNMINVETEKKGIDFSLEIDESVPEIVLGDAFRLKRVALNLLANAVKFTEHGFIHFKVSSIVREKEEWVEMSIADSGIGIAEDAQTHLFEAFTQADISTSRRFGGTGLGLAISRQIAFLMNGYIKVISKLGAGSTFILTFPVQRAGKSVLQEKEAVPDIKFYNIKLLLVEDNTVNLYMTEEILVDFGFTVTIADSGRKAIELSAADKYDLILMDIRMPIMDGYETAECIQKSSKNIDTPIIALSADVFGDVQKKVFASGMAGYLEKPLQLDKLGRILSAVLKIPVTALPASVPITDVFFDPQSVIEKLSGKTSVYKKVLSLFYLQHQNDAEEIEKCILRGDRSRAFECLHELKGAAGNIGANGLYKAAADLYDMLKEERTEGTVNNFIGIFINSMEKIDKYLRRQAEEVSPIAALPNASAADTHKLLQMLQSGDFTAKESCRRMKAVLCGIFGKNFYTRLWQEVNIYDFPAAAVLLSNEMQNRKDEL